MHKVKNFVNDSVSEIQNFFSQWGEILISDAAKYGQTSLVKFLVKVGFNPKSTIWAKRTGRRDLTSLIKSITGGHLDTVKYLVSVGCLEINQEEIDATLINASEKGHLEIVKFLVELGCDPVINGRHSLSLAAINGHIETLKYLISIGCNPQNIYEHTLSNSAIKGYFEVTKYLVLMGCDPEYNAYRPLAVCVGVYDDVETHDYMLSTLPKKNQYRYLKILRPSERKFVAPVLKRILLRKMNLKYNFLKNILGPRSMHMQLSLL
jgi:hypothetical protein